MHKDRQVSFEDSTLRHFALSRWREQVWRWSAWWTLDYASTIPVPSWL